MRSMVLGGVAAIVFLAAIFAAGHFRPGAPAAGLSSGGIPASPPSAATLEKIARTIKPGFVGTQGFGAWDLICVKVRPIPPWARAMFAGTNAASRMPRPAQAGRPRPPRCHVALTLNDAPIQFVSVNFSLLDHSGGIKTFMKIAAGHTFPGEALDLQLDSGVVAFRVIFCGKTDCVALPVMRMREAEKHAMRKADEFAEARHAVLLVPAALGQKAVQLSIPMEGLHAAIAAMRRLGTA